MFLLFIGIDGKVSEHVRSKFAKQAEKIIFGYLADMIREILQILVMQISHSQMDMNQRGLRVDLKDFLVIRDRLVYLSLRKQIFPGMNQAVAFLLSFRIDTIAIDDLEYLIRNFDSLLLFPAIKQAKR